MSPISLESEIIPIFGIVLSFGFIECQGIYRKVLLYFLSNLAMFNIYIFPAIGLNTGCIAYVHAKLYQVLSCFIHSWYYWYYTVLDTTRLALHIIALLLYCIVSANKQLGLEN